jgi:hypothetical protein
MKKNWPGNKYNEIEEEIQAEVREQAERSSRIQSMKLANIIVTLKKVEFLKKDNMEEEALFPEEVKLDVIPVENHGTNLGNVLRERKKEEVKHKLLKHRSMWKKKKQKEERTS